MKIIHFMRSLRINGFKTDAPYNAVHCDELFVKVPRWGPQEKFYGMCTAMLNTVAYVYRA